MVVPRDSRRDIRIPDEACGAVSVVKQGFLQEYITVDGLMSEYNDDQPIVVFSSRRYRSQYDELSEFLELKNENFSERLKFPELKNENLSITFDFAHSNMMVKNKFYY